MLQTWIQGKLGLICVQFVCGMSVEDLEVKCCVCDVCSAWSCGWVYDCMCVLLSVRAYVYGANGFIVLGNNVKGM